MAFHQKNPQCSPSQPLQSRSEPQGLEAAQAPEAVEKARVSYPPMRVSVNQAPPRIPSSPESPQSSSSSSVVTTITLSSTSSEQSSSQEEGHSTSEGVSIDALDESVTLLVEFLLVKYKAKEPVTKAEMLKIVSEEYQDHFTDILLQASERMEMIFGLDVKKVNPILHRYAIIIKLGLTYDGMLHGEKGVPKTSILIVLLGAIFMKGNRATEEEIWKVLSVMKLYPGKKHDIFGDPSCLITKHFVEEGYLKYQKVANSDPAQYEFLWGPRAHAETSKMQVLKYLAKVYGSDPSSFPSQYEEAFEEELEITQNRIVTDVIDIRGNSPF